MNNIGYRIKEFRKKKGYTQEDLATALGVTFQSVSKWENNVNAPDLALIVPLAEVLNVSTDELLGANAKAKQLSEFEKLYEEAFSVRKNYSEETIAISKRVVTEYPSELKWTVRYAWERWCSCVDSVTDGAVFENESNDIIRLFDRVIGNTDDYKIKTEAIHGIVIVLCYKGHKEEAKRYLDMYPGEYEHFWEREKLICCCLEGEEQKKQKEKMLFVLLREMVDLLIWQDIWHNKDACDAAQKIIEAVIQNENYCEYHQDISRIKLKQAENELKEGRYQQAEDLIRNALYHAREFDKISVYHRGEYYYTAPLLDHIVVDTNQWSIQEDTLLEEHIAALSQRKVFQPLREREDFKALLKE